VIVFLDSSALIYYFEGVERYRQAVVDTLEAIKKNIRKRKWLSLALV
jgi:hypothetical protein